MKQISNISNICDTGMFLKPSISVNTVPNFFPGRKICISTVVRTLFPVTLVFNLTVALIPIAILAPADSAYADDTHWTEEAADEAKAMLKEKLKDGLSAEDVQDITGFLQDRVGDDLDGTGVGELLGAMNTQAENVTKVQDFADKLDKSIDLVEKVMEAKETGDGKAMMEALGAGVTLAGELAGKVPVIGVVIGPMMGAYGQAINNGATHVEALEAANTRTAAIIAATQIGAGESEAEDAEEGEEFTFGFSYPYCPGCDVPAWSAGNAEANLDRETLKGMKIDAELKLLENDKANGKTTALYDGQVVPIDIAIDRLEYEQGASDEAIKKAQEHFDDMRQWLIDELEETLKEAEAAEQGVGIFGDIYNGLLGIGQSLMELGIFQEDESGRPVRTDPPDLDSVLSQAAVSRVLVEPFQTPGVTAEQRLNLLKFRGAAAVSIGSDPDSITSNAQSILESAAGGGETTTRLAQIGETAHTGNLGHCVSGVHHNPSFHADCQSAGPSGGGDVQ